jgi:RimJ/RimL family protein N-acetyltransferase
MANYILIHTNDMFEFAKNELVGPSAGWQPHKTKEESLDIIKMFIEDSDVYAIKFKEDKKVIGSFGIHNCHHDKNLSNEEQKDLGFVLSPDYWGQGIIPEVTRTIISHCFNELGIKKIWCWHYDFNTNSKRVIEKCGFSFQFTKEEILERLDGRSVMTYYYYSISNNS